MDENKEIDISRTILNTIKLLEEEITSIEKIDIETYEKIRKKLDEIYDASKNKKLNVIEIVNLLMQLQNETITFLDTSMQNSMELQIYKPQSQNPIKRFFVMLKNKIIEISKLGQRKISDQTSK